MPEEAYTLPLLDQSDDQRIYMIPTEKYMSKTWKMCIAITSSKRVCPPGSSMVERTLGFCLSLLTAVVHVVRSLLDNGVL